MDDAVISQRVDKLMRDAGLYDRARTAIERFATTRTVGDAAPDEDIVDALRESGVVNELVAALNLSGFGNDVLAALATSTVGELEASARRSAVAPLVDTTPAQPVSAAGKRTFKHTRPRTTTRTECMTAGERNNSARAVLVVRLGGGRAFSPHLACSSGVDNAERAAGKYVVHALLCGQRAATQPCLASSHPDFRDIVVFDVTPAQAADEYGTPQALLQSAGRWPLHILLTMSTTADGESSESGLVHAPLYALVGAAVIDWRLILAEGNASGESGIHAVPPGWSLAASMDTSFALAPAGASSLALLRTAALVDSASRDATTGGVPPVGLVFAQLELYVVNGCYSQGTEANAHEDSAPHISDAAWRATSRLAAGTESVLRLLPRDEIVGTAKLDADDAAAASHSLLAAARAWWTSLKTAHPHVVQRPVRIFAASPKGEYIPTPGFLCWDSDNVEGGLLQTLSRSAQWEAARETWGSNVARVIRGGLTATSLRLLPSVRDCARFVSLLPLRTVCGIGVDADGENSAPTFGSWSIARGTDDVWQDAFTTLARGACSCAADYAILLASLLLAHGLDAAVVIGSRIDVRTGDAVTVDHDAMHVTEHTWVVTLRKRRPASAHARQTQRTGFTDEVTLWDPVTGTRCDAVGTTGAHGAAALRNARVACAFTARAFYACVAHNSHAAHVSWAFDGSDWQALDSARLLAALPSVRTPSPPLLASTLDAASLAERIEEELRRRVSRYRADDTSLSAGGSVASTTVFDDALSALLAPGLAACEAAASRGQIGGCTHDADDDGSWHDALARAAPAGSSVRGVPLLVNHARAGEIMRTILQSQAGREVLLSRSTRLTRFALRAQAWVGPENALALWIMLAVVEPRQAGGAMGAGIE